MFCSCILFAACNQNIDPGDKKADKPSFVVRDSSCIGLLNAVEYGDTLSIGAAGKQVWNCVDTRAVKRWENPARRVHQIRIIQAHDVWVDSQQVKYLSATHPLGIKTFFETAIYFFDPGADLQQLLTKILCIKSTKHYRCVDIGDPTGDRIHIVFIFDNEGNQQEMQINYLDSKYLKNQKATIG